MVPLAFFGWQKSVVSVLYRNVLHIYKTLLFRYSQYL
jgi:hypothetical protein